MSETPLPQIISAMPSADTLEERTGVGETRPRKRSLSSASRPVSAFAPGTTPPRSEASSGVAGLSPDDLAFVAALRGAGIALELTETVLARTAQRIRGTDRPARRLDLLEAYYSAEDDALAAQRRQATDRWFLFNAADALNAAQLLARLLNVVPELRGTELERVGGEEGTLVLRAGDDVCALEDEREDAPGLATISVCDLVRGLNVLLDRRFVRARLVGLIGDGTREGYLALPSVTAAIALSSADYLAAPDAEALLDLTGW